MVAPDLSTSTADIYAIGECASWNNETYGLIGPGVEMADVLAFNLTQAKGHSPRSFTRPDLSTKLKLLGCNVASFGDFFADRDGPKMLPSGRRPKDSLQDKSKATTPPPPVKALIYKDPFSQVYKKYLFTMDGKYLLGGMMIGDTNDYIKLVPLTRSKKPLEMPPGELMIGNQSGDDDGADLSVRT